MYIDEVTIEGFKSFSKKITIQKLDPQFNAITGQNGTGKSNILDAICFVLGMKNLAQLRVKSLQELIFSRGTQGVTKASVSITFINDNPDRGPLAYKDDKVIIVTRQVQLGGHDKYQVNGKTEVLKKVRDLFCSVQLNVNNPHFLIMQGSISKVLGMSPKETMGLLEEAAGTSLYESKRTEALKSLYKKDSQLNEIDALLEEELQPRVQRLQEERDQYLRWQEADRQHKGLQQFVQAYDYYQLLRNIERRGEADLEFKQQLQDIQKIVSQTETDTKMCKKRQQDLIEAKEAQHGPQIRQLKDAIKNFKKQMTEQESQLENQRDNLEQDTALQKELQERFSQVSVEVLQGKYNEAKKQAEKSEQCCDESVKLLDQLKTELKGLTGVQNQQLNCTMKERMNNNKTQQMNVQHEIQQLQAQIQANQQNQDSMSGVDEQGWQQIQNQIAQKQQDVAQLQQQIQQIAYDDAKYRELCHQRGELERESRKMRTDRDELRRRMQELNNGVQHREYCGTVAELIKVKKQDCIVAINVAAGPNLCNAIMEREEVAKELIKSKKLPKKVRFTSLDAVKGKTVSENKLQAAQQMVGNNACLALDLIEYDMRFDSVMKFVFGSTFICKDKETASRLSDVKGRVACKCVTLEGDLYQPGGLLTGGSRKLQNILLQKMTTYREADTQCRNMQQQHNQICQQVGEMEQRHQQHNRVKQELDKVQLDLNKSLKQSEQMEEEVRKFQTKQQELQNQQQELADKQQQLEELVKKQEELKYQCDNFEEERGNIMKDTQQKIKQQEQVVKEKTKISKQAQMMLTEISTEIEAANVERPQLEQQLQDVQRRIQQFENEIRGFDDSLQQIGHQHEQATQALEEKRQELKGQDEEIQNLDEQIDQLKNQKMELEGRRLNVDREMQENEHYKNQAEEQSKRMETDFPFISTEKQKFGEQGTIYDWQACNPDEARRQLQKCVETIETLGQNVNQNVLVAQQEVLTTFNQLVEKRKKLDSDKRKIQQVIGDLDDRQRVTLQKVWQKVNSDMGRIFNSLLPGTQATLEPPTGKTFLEGLIIKVAFGDQRKSLQEMSGGQRSLLALSFLLALLLFKPAPIYILDEVDAALDLVHTQNIGKMIKQYFPYSQFLVVSHKEGMFSNANVLFRTKFMENSTQVQRMVNQESTPRKSQGK